MLFDIIADIEASIAYELLTAREICVTDLRGVAEEDHLLSTQITIFLVDYIAATLLISSPGVGPARKGGYFLDDSVIRVVGYFKPE